MLLIKGNPFLLFWVLPLLAKAFVAAGAAGSCTEVKLSQCGVEFTNSCLQCGNESSYDCVKCCPGCEGISKGAYRFCECKKPTPPPFPPPGNDSWTKYTVAGLDSVAVVGGSDPSRYEKVVIMLHGGGGSGSDWEYNYEQGWFGNLEGLKYVFPTSAFESHVWYISYKNGCGLFDDCAYNLSSIHDSASRVAALIDHERNLVGGDASNIYLAGFSQGAQLTSYMQIAHLNFALGGAIIMDGFPLPPLCDMPRASKPQEAKKNATYYGSDMNFFLWQGEADTIFPSNMTTTAYHEIFDILGVRSTLKVDHTEPGQPHDLIKSEFDEMVKFIRGEPSYYT